MDILAKQLFQNKKNSFSNKITKVLSEKKFGQYQVFILKFHNCQCTPCKSNVCKVNLKYDYKIWKIYKGDFRSGPKHIWAVDVLINRFLC